MNNKHLNNIQKEMSKVNSILSIILLVFSVFFLIESKDNSYILWVVSSALLAVMDVLMRASFMGCHKVLWIAVRIVEVLVCSVNVNLDVDVMLLTIVAITMVILILELIFSFEYSDLYTRIITIACCDVPSFLILILSMLLNSLDPLMIFEKICLMFAITAFCVIVAETFIKEIGMIEEVLYEQRRMADNTKEINSELKVHQEKVKHSNEQLGVQKIKLEAAYNRINAANAEMILQNDILRAITSVLNVEKLLNIMTESLKQELELSCCAIMIKSEAASNEESICVVQSNLAPDMQDAMRVFINDGGLNSYFERRQAFIDNHVHADTYPFIYDNNSGSLLILPMIKDNICIGGLLCIHQKFDFFADNIVFFNTVMAQFMIALDNCGLYTKMQQMAVRDGLTGIYNRGHLNQKMEEFISNAKESGEPISIALFDIDHFKHVNDTYGHLFGDTVIKTVAGFAKEMSKKYRGFAARYGGEEFVVAFPGRNVETVKEIVEEMRSLLYQMKLEHEGQQVAVRVSVGVTGYPECCQKPDFLLEHADWAMYYSKEHGRDRVTVDSPEIREQLGLKGEEAMK